jgi:hypothetical protein
MDMEIRVGGMTKKIIRAEVMTKAATIVINGIMIMITTSETKGIEIVVIPIIMIDTILTIGM